MESVSLKSLLQLQLASDSSAVINLPLVLTSLTSDDFLPSSHLSKWTTRINSLLHSKEAGGRWAGLCLAQKTSLLSKNTMVEFSQSWLGVALPILSRNEPLPNLKSAIRLVRLILVAGLGAPEFQRQVVTPNVPKFTTAIIGLAEKYHDEELKLLVLTTLTRLVPLYPTLHRPSHAALSALSLRFLDGSAPNPTSKTLLEAASRLYAALHFTGGKVGAANLWRKALDETLGFVWSSFSALRSTFATEGQRETSTSSPPHISILLNLDRLRCGTVVICDLLSATTHRPVQVPLGAILKLIMTLLSCTKDDKRVDYSDPDIRAMEVAIIPDIWKFSCDMLSCLAKCVRHHLTPNLTRLMSYLTFRLEQNPTPPQRLFFLTTIRNILAHCHHLDSPLVSTRLVKTILPSISDILSAPPDSQNPENTPAMSNRGRKGRKRARGYEGDEVFKVVREVICPTIDHGKVLLTALEVMQLLLRNPHVSSAMHSLSSRVLLNVLLLLPQISPAALSPDPSLHTDLCELVHVIGMEIGSGSASVMSKSLGLVIRATVAKENNIAPLRDLDILLHPRVPPLVRSLPHSQEEGEAREALKRPPSVQDVEMEEETRVRLAQTFIAPLPLSERLINIRNRSPTDPKPGMEENAAPIDIVSQPPALHLHPVPTTTSANEEEDEEMPAINLDSDSDGN
ncbi:hypothetical protein L208DRAFT_1421135 [Tricholoma matsutake]|nr:hypothetical protein L208DRAFT_1421135 [Tricholoma matsutake 945]